MNKAILIGRVGRDPNNRTLESGAKMADFTMATTEYYKDKNGEKSELTTWHNCVVWGKLADVVIEYVKKGILLSVVGKINNRSYEKDGEKKYVTEVVVSELHMLSKPQDIGRSEAVPPPPPATREPDPDGDDLPF